MAAPPAAADEDAREADAMALLLRMADFIAKAPRFSVDIRSGYDVVQPTGEKIEFGELRRVLVQRPAQLSIDSESSDGRRRQVMFDGKTVTVASPDAKVYAQHAQSGDIDQTLRLFKQKLHLRMPLAPLLTNNFPAELERRVVSIVGVESSTHLGEVVHHLAARGNGVDMQIWISDGEQPLPRRIVLTYPNAEGQPQYRADFDHWNLAPKIDAAAFTFVPASDAAKIAFINQLERAVPTAQSGAQP